MPIASLDESEPETTSTNLLEKGEEAPKKKLALVEISANEVDNNNNNNDFDNGGKAKDYLKHGVTTGAENGVVGASKMSDGASKKEGDGGAKMTDGAAKMTDGASNEGGDSSKRKSDGAAMSGGDGERASIAKETNRLGPDETQLCPDGAIDECSSKKCSVM